MFWWKSNPIKIERQSDGKLSLKIAKTVKPIEYIEFIRGLMSEVNLTQACEVLVKNGHTSAYQEVIENIFNYDVAMAQVIMQAAGVKPKNKDDDDDNREIIKPLKGIITE